MSIVGFGVYTGGGLTLFKDLNGTKLEGNPTFERVILSTKNNFYDRMKQLEGMGIPRQIIIDGVIFGIPGFDFKNFIETGKVVARLKPGRVAMVDFSIYPRIYIGSGYAITMGTKSAIAGAEIDGFGMINIGKYSQLSWKLVFEMQLAMATKYYDGHDYHSVLSFDPAHLSWHGIRPKPLQGQQKPCRIMFGNDVWVGRGCFFKSNDPDRPLVIGDGAVIASDSVVVKSVEPYTIVGGNPARFIKYRFDDPKVIEGLQRIRWWDWSLDKIHDNYKYFDDPRAFVERFDQ